MQHKHGHVHRPLTAAAPSAPELKSSFLSVKRRPCVESRSILRILVHISITCARSLCGADACKPAEKC